MKNIFVVFILVGSFGVFADEYYFVCNELDDDLKITSYEKVLIINTKEKYMKFNDVKHTGYFKNTDLIVEASYLESTAENGSILNFEKITGKPLIRQYGRIKLNSFEVNNSND